MYYLLGLLTSVLIGIILGLIGGGGSILTLPVMVYLLGVSPVIATAYSLFVVGVTSLVGSLSYIQKKLVNYRVGVVFAVPSFVSVFLTRKFVVPLIPDTLFNLGGFDVTKNTGIVLLFALIMLATSFSMIRNNNELNVSENTQKIQLDLPFIALEGLGVGFLTGLVGAGGGFLIIPALVLLARLPMKTAVGTSLLIIATKSLIGFLGDVSYMPLDWPFLLQFSGFSVVGIFIGTYLSKFIDGQKLKKAFGWFVLTMAIFMIVKEIAHI